MTIHVLTADYNCQQRIVFNRIITQNNVFCRNCKESEKKNAKRINVNQRKKCSSCKPAAKSPRNRRANLISIKTLLQVLVKALCNDTV